MAAGGEEFPFNFPVRPSIYQKRQFFGNYGPSLVSDSSAGGIIFQKCKPDDFMTYSAVNPILPLSPNAERVNYPMKDRIIGKVLEKNRQLKEFSAQVSKFHMHSKRFGKYGVVKQVKESVEDIHNRWVEDVISQSEAVAEFDEVNTQIQSKQWMSNFIRDYGNLKDMSAYLLKNYHYAGGCIASLQTSDNYSFIVSAAGSGFDTLRLSFVSEKKDSVLQCYTVEELKLPSSVYGISSNGVQGQDLVCVRMKNVCNLYTFRKDARDSKLKATYKLHMKGLQSVDLSPYIPGECAVLNSDGECYLWNSDSKTKILDNLRPRFAVHEAWGHIQFGSHPREIIYANQSFVQMYDLRAPNKDGIDLLSLPCKLLRNKEHIQLCGRLPVSDFCHVVATDDQLLIMDERFPQCPVLSWEHMHSAPPQYMSCIKQGVGESDCHFLYVASQFPADTHVFRFTQESQCPPVAVSLPYRASSLREFCNVAEYTEKCPNTDRLLDQLKSSVAGISTFTIGNRHVLLQLDCHGQIFHQVFAPKKKSLDESLQHSSQVCREVNPVAVERAQTWVQSWVDMMKQQMSMQRIARPVMHDLLGMFHYRAPHPLCRVCRPELQHMPQDSSDVSQTEMCETCMVKIVDGPCLIQSVEKDSIPQSGTSLRPSGLQKPEVLPVPTVLSRLLRQHWYNGYNKEELSDLLHDWDTEVKEKMKRSKEKKNEQPDMSEDSVLQRILSQDGCSRVSVGINLETVALNASSGPQPDTTGVDNESGSQLVRTDDHLSNTGSQLLEKTDSQNIEPSITSDVDFQVTQSKNGVTKLNAKQTPKRNFASVVLVSPEKESVISFALGSVDTFESGVFPSQNTSAVHVNNSANKRTHKKKRHGKFPNTVASPEKSSPESVVSASVVSEQLETFPRLNSFHSTHFLQSLSLQHTPKETRQDETGQSLFNGSESLFSTDSSLHMSPKIDYVKSKRTPSPKKKGKQRLSDKKKKLTESSFSEKGSKKGSRNHVVEENNNDDLSSPVLNPDSERSVSKKSSGKKRGVGTNSKGNKFDGQGSPLEKGNKRKGVKRKLVEGF